MDHKGTKVWLALSVIAIAAMFLAIPVAAAAPKNPAPVLERRILEIRRTVNPARPPAPPGLNTYEGYELLGVKWRTLPVTYVVDPDNPYNLTESFVVNAFVSAAEEWDAHTGAELFGAYTIDYNCSWDSDAIDGRNEMLFGTYPDANVIAVAVVWGYFSGPPAQRRIVEFDVLLNVRFAWGDATVDPTVMDVQNIATHELGHGVGLGDLYDSKYYLESMYGYASHGETLKRTLYVGDIAGVQKLYGA